MTLERNSECILVADDDEGIRNMLFFLLTKMGHQVVLAENGEQAFELFTRESFSLVLTDLSMPEMNGFELAAKVKSMSPHTPIIMLTGSRIEDDKELGCVDHLLYKPFQLGDVHRTVEIALSGGFFRPPAEGGTEFQIQG
ncbi:MAG: response regulator [Desulfobacteraceae bacterium]|nr:MAG: response regulator [Desulfobacteraceae bacterium]